MKLSDAFEQKTDCPDLELKLIRRDEREIGREEGLQKGIKCYILDNLENHVPDERIIIKLQKNFRHPTRGRKTVSFFLSASKIILAWKNLIDTL